jgi:hypothetical protein
MQNMKLCNTLAYAGFDPKAEAKKQARAETLWPTLTPSSPALWR